MINIANMAKIGDLKSCLLELVVAVSGICSRCSHGEEITADITDNIVQVLNRLFEISDMFGLKLNMITLNKLEVNNRKYQSDLCQDEVKRYWSLSKSTGITKEKQPEILTAECMSDSPQDSHVEFLTELPTIVQKVENFVKERNWEHVYTSTSVALAMVGEVGELCDIVTWRSDSEDICSLKPKVLEAIAQEIADVTIYTLHMCRVAGVETVLVFEVPAGENLS